MTKFHEIQAGQLAELARGDGGPEAIASLRDGQLSRHLLLIRHLMRNWPGDTAVLDATATVLHQVSVAAPAQFGEVLGAPLVGAWTGIAVRAVERGLADPSDCEQLCGIAVVAAAAAGLSAELPVPVRDGVVSVPGHGVLRTAATTARLLSDQGDLYVIAGDDRVLVSPDTEFAGWQPVRHLHTDDGVTVALDDVDPYRHGHHVPPANRLDDAQIEQWQTLFAEGWGLLARRLPARAAELAAGLKTLIPLTDLDGRSARSATLRNAFGAFGLTCPPSAAEFAVTLVHEFQHSKLSAMVDVAEMTNPGETRRFFAPWRRDPRPLAGLLQGVYAFVGVADTWRALQAEPSLADLAATRFAEARLQVDLALASVEGSGALTEAGQRLAAGLRARTDELLAEPLDPRKVQDAQEALAETHRRWAELNELPVAAK